MRSNRLRRQVLAAAVATGFLGAFQTEAAAFQRTGDLRGRILDARSNRPLAGVEVSIVTVNYTARTDEQGEYSFSGIPAGRYTLLVRGRGFKPAIASQHMLMSDTVNVLDFKLDPTGETRPDPTEAPEEDNRRATMAVNVFGPDDLPDNQELIRALRGRVAGLEIARPESRLGADRAQRGVTLRSIGRQVLWVIDGTVITPPLSFDLNTSQVACVEIRRGASAAQRFARNIRSELSVGYSGVILVWTHGTRADLPEGC